MENNWRVYAHINKINGNVYVGITSQPLSRRFKNGGGYKKSPYFYAAIQKYGWDSFEHIVVAQNLKEDDAKTIERIVIASLKEQGISLYNLTVGGDGMSGSKQSEESIRKLSESLKGKPKTEEHKKHLSESRIGRFNGAKNPHFGHHHSERVRKLIGDAHRGLKNVNFGRAGKDTTASKRVRQYSLNGKFIKEYPSISEASRENGIGVSGISKCCLGKFSQSHGYKWVFVPYLKSLKLETEVAI